MSNLKRHVGFTELAEIIDALDDYGRARLGVSAGGLLKVAVKSFIRQRKPEKGSMTEQVLKPWYEEK